jgi:hypothetical protein
MSRWTQIDDNAAGPPQPGGPGRITYGDDAHPDAITLHSDGRLLTNHDAEYALNARAMDASATAVLAGGAATEQGMPRWTLAAGERVKGAFPIDSGWDAVTVRFLGSNESGVAGTVTFEFNYSLLYITGTSLEDVGTDIAGITVNAVATQFQGQYNSPAGLASLDTPNMFVGAIDFGKPFMRWSLTRIGGTLAARYGIAGVTITRAAA